MGSRKRVRAFKYARKIRDRTGELDPIGSVDAASTEPHESRAQGFRAGAETGLLDRIQLGVIHSVVDDLRVSLIYSFDSPGR